MDAPEHIHTHTQAPDESITARDSAHVNVNRFTLPRSPWELLVAVILALSVAVNVWCAFTIRDIGTRKWLHDYDLEQFKGHEFAELRNNVEVTKLLIAAQCNKPKEK